MYSINHYFDLSKTVLIATITGEDLSKRITAVSFPFIIHKEYGYIYFAETIISFLTAYEQHLQHILKL
jgi:hypothetical protein